MPEANTESRTTILKRRIGDYLDSLGSSAPTPGGGSAAGLIGALGASLGSMVVSLTFSEDADVKAALDHADESLRALRDRFTGLAEADEAVYQAYRDAAAMPKGSAGERAVRRETMQQALKDAASVPLEACAASVELAQTLVAVQQHGNPHLLSDAQIGMLCAQTCFESSRINVNVNLAMIRDDAWVTDVANRVEELSSQLREHLQSS